jgi:soluble lytic murein transglycosylase-like protein
METDFVFGQRYTFPITVIASLILTVFLIAATKGMKTPPTSTTPSTALQNQQNTDAIYKADSANNQNCRVSPNFPEPIFQWCELITTQASQHGLDPNLVAAVILQESAGNPAAYSHSGAVGLMQVMPRDGLAASFMCPAGPCFKDRPSISELENPEFNVAYGVKMLAGLIKRLGSEREALRAYGPMDVGYYYSDKVLSLYNNYQ